MDSFMQKSTLRLPRGSSSPLRLILLVAETMPQPIESASGTHHDIFVTLFRTALLSLAPQSADGDAPELTLESYDVLAGSYPSPSALKGANGVLITGSTASAYEPIPWITTLSNFITSLPSLYPSLKIFGICFGHQLISRAFGGEVVKNPLGWEIGVRDLDLTEVGVQVFKSHSSLPIQQFHQDHVPHVVPGFEILGSTSICPVHGMIKRVPSTVAGAPLALEDISIFTLQGHPEFTPSIVHGLLDSESSEGSFPDALIAESRKLAEGEDRGLEIAKVMLCVLGMHV